jgi:beta-lactam-binding protein with PASTA domain
MVTVPNVVGTAQAAAQSAITSALLIVGNVTTANSDTVAAGDVISQAPTGGASIAAGSTVDIVVSLGEQMYTVPNVVGSAQSAAQAAITAASLTVGTVSAVYSDAVPAGNVISQSPASGASVVFGTPVDLLVSLGVQMVTVPDVVGLAQATAEANIVAAILTVGNVTTATSATVPAGDVISQSPTAGASVVHDSTVDIVVSIGDEPPLEFENVLLPANGGVLESFTSEYSGTWGMASGLTNGITTDNGWCSTVNPEPFQEFIWSFDSGNSSILSEAVVHGGLAEGLYFSKDVEVWTSLNGSSYTMAASGTLPSGSYSSITLDLGDVEATKVKLMITSGYRTDYWEMGEFIVMGAPGSPPPSTTVPDVVGMTQASAESTIAGASLNSSVSTDYSETVPAGSVISQSIAGGTTVNQGTTIGIVVSDGPPPSGDTVTIAKAEFKSDRSELKVEATSSDGGSVTLTLVGYGTMTYKSDKNKYEYKATVGSAPSTITVTSSGGGSATKTVTQK